MNSQSMIKNKHSLRRKIMLPFFLIIGMLAIFSTAVSIYFVSAISEKSVEDQLVQSHTLSSDYLRKRLQKLAYFSSILPKLEWSSKNEEPLFSGTHEFVKEVLRQEQISGYASAEELPEFKKRLYRNEIQEKTTTDAPLPFIYKSTTGTYILFAAFNSVNDHSGKKNFTVADFVLDNRWAETLYRSLNIQLAFFYRNPSASGEYEMISAPKSLIQHPYFQDMLAKRMNNYPGKQFEPYFEDFQTPAGRFKAFIRPSILMPQVYEISILSITAYQTAKFKLISFIITIFLLISILILVIYTILIHKITSSIEILATAAKRVADGDLNQKIFINNKDEIGQLSTIFNQMVLNLKLFQRRLQDEKNRSEAIISYLPEGIIVTDLENKLVLANPLAEQMFNFSSDELNGKKLLEFITNEEVMHSLKENVGDTISTITREFTITKDKETKEIYELSSSFARDKEDMPIGIITILRDITHDKELEELREGFLRTVSHELRTPLTSIIGFLELLDYKNITSLSDKQQGYISIAHTEANHLKNLIEDLLELSKIRAGQLQLVYTKVSAKDLVNSILTIFMPLAKGKSLSITSHITEEIVFEADLPSIRRVLINLVSNAIKFTHEGEVNISVKRQESTNDEHSDTILFSVKDTGIGIKKEEQGVIFEKFRQVDYSSTRKYEGIGLGLSIVKQLVDLHKGDVWIESDYGNGSTFHFKIPITPKKA